MPIRTWLVATILIGTVTIATIILAPITYTIMDLLNATGPASGEGRTSINLAMNMGLKVFPWTILVIIEGLLIWAFTRPQHKEYESYIE